MIETNSQTKARLLALARDVQGRLRESSLANVRIQRASLRPVVPTHTDGYAISVGTAAVEL